MNKVGRPLLFKTVEEVEEKIQAYFAECDEKDIPYTITGIALALNTDRHTLINYGNREDFFHTIKNAKMKCENYAENYLYKGKNVAGAIFNLKNNYGWIDKQDTEIKGDLTLNGLLNELDGRTRGLPDIKE